MNVVNQYEILNASRLPTCQVNVNVKLYFFLTLARSAGTGIYLQFVEYSRAKRLTTELVVVTQRLPYRESRLGYWKMEINRMDINI